MSEIGEPLKRLDATMSAYERQARLFQRASDNLFEVQALLDEIEGTKAQITKLDYKINILFPDDNDLHARDALKARLNSLLAQLDEMCIKRTSPSCNTTE